MGKENDKDCVETLDSQINRLAKFIMAEVDGEPSRSEGAVDCSIRVIRKLQGYKEKFEKAVSDISDQKSVQGSSGNWDYDEYMRGMYNGIECALATMQGKDPIYRSQIKEKVLHVYDDGTDLMVAYSEEDAQTCREETFGVEEEYENEYRRLPDEQLLRIAPDEDNRSAYEEKSCREWCDKEGRGFLSSREN